MGGICNPTSGTFLLAMVCSLASCVWASDDNGRLDAAASGSDQCSMGPALRELIDRATDAAIGGGQVNLEALDLIDAAEKAAGPPECDQERAQALAERALEIEPAEPVTPVPAQDTQPAETPQKKVAGSGKLDPGAFDSGDFALAEGVIALMSWMAAEEPNGYGTLLLAVTPWSIAETEAEFPGDDDTLGMLAVVGIVAVIAGYNISVDEDDYDKSEVFRNNFLFYNLLIGGGYLLNKLADDDRQSHEPTAARASLGLRPFEGGIELSWRYRF